MILFFIHILIDRFGEMGDKYILNYTISTSKADKALNFDGTVHRIEISGSVSFNLKDKENGIELLSDKEEMYLSYSNSGSTAAVLNAERTTNKQLVVLLADKVADRVSLAILEKGFMKLTSRDLISFFEAPPKGVMGVLIYGNDHMRVASKREKLIHAILGPKADEEMRLARISRENLKKIT